MEHLYRKKFIILIILGLIIIACLNSNAKAKFKDIPSPILDIDQNLEIAQGGLLTIKGSGFINNYPSIHKVKLSKISAKNPTKLNLAVLISNANYLITTIPNGIELGDYDLGVKIKSKLLKSKLAKSLSALRVRPKAPAAPNLEYQVFAKQSDLDNFLVSETGMQREINGTLQIGANQIFQSYMREGFQSLKSPMVNFYYLPETEMESQLKIDSEIPIKSFAIEKLENKAFDVSNVTNSEIEELSKSFFLKTQSNPRYLEYSNKLSPVFFEKIHPLEDEFAIIKNRSSNSFALIGCILADSIQNRYKFTDKDSIPAHQSITINQNLGLNNTSPDSLKLQCPDASKTLITIDEFKYEKIDADGFGIRI